MYDADQKWQQVQDTEYEAQDWSDVHGLAASWDLGAHGINHEYSVVRVFNKKKNKLSELTAANADQLNQILNKYDGIEHIELTVYNQASMWHSFELSEV